MDSSLQKELQKVKSIFLLRIPYVIFQIYIQTKLIKYSQPASHARVTFQGTLSQNIEYSRPLLSTGIPLLEPPWIRKTVDVQSAVFGIHHLSNLTRMTPENLLRPAEAICITPVWH